MLVTTTPGIDGRPVTGYLGIVTAQGVLGAYVSRLATQTALGRWLTDLLSAGGR